MKTKRLVTYRRITRIINLLGIIFLLSGLILSMVNGPAQAAAPDTSLAPTRLPPGGGHPPALPTNQAPGPVAPAQPPSRQPSAPRPVGPSDLSNLSQGQSALPNLSARPGVSPQMALPATSINFTQSDYCFNSVNKTPITATALVKLPAGVTGTVVIAWRGVNPVVPGTSETVENVTDGQSIPITGEWPGNLTEGTTEIHFEATLYVNGVDTSISQLDVFFNSTDGSCSPGFPLELTYTCDTASNTVAWTVKNNNIGSTRPSYYTYTVDGVATGSGTLMPDKSDTFTTPGGVHTVEVTYTDGTGATKTVKATSTNCLTSKPPTLAATCSTSDGRVLWVLTNPNAVDIPFTWTLGAESGSGTLPANGSVDITTSDPSTTQTMVVKWAGPDISTVYTGGTCPAPSLTLDHACSADNLQIVWRVTNKSTFPIPFEWNLDNGAATGSLTVPGGGTINFGNAPGNVAHSMAVTYAGGTLNNQSTANECQPEPVVLTILKDCAAGQIRFQVHNPSNGSVTFTWSLDNGLETTATVGAGETVDVVSQPPGVYTLTINWNGNQTASLKSTGEECGAVPVVVSHTCGNIAGRIDWFIQNTSATSVKVHWVLDNSSLSGDVTLAAGEKVRVTDSSSGAHELVATWPTGNTASDSSKAGECSVPKPKDLSLRFSCGNDQVLWKVSNPNDKEISFNWTLDGKAKGTEKISARGSKNILKTDPGKEHTVKITWGDGSGGTTSASLTASGGACSAGGPSLDLGYACIAGTNTIQWSVKNGSTTAANFDWNLDSGAETGSDSVAASGTRFFLVTAAGAHTVRITSASGGNAFAELSSSATSCMQVITRTPTPTRMPTNTPAPTLTPTSTSTPLPTVGAPPAVGGAGPVASGGKTVISVTGADLAGSQPVNLWQKLLMNLGLLFLGIGLVGEGVLRRVN